MKILEWFRKFDSVVLWVECENKYGSNAVLQRWLARLLVTISLLLADKSFLRWLTMQEDHIILEDKAAPSTREKFVNN